MLHARLMAVLTSLVLLMQVGARWSEVRDGLRLVGLAEQPPCAVRWDGPRDEALVTALDRPPMERLTRVRDGGQGAYAAVQEFENVCVRALTDSLLGLGIPHGNESWIGTSVSRTFLGGELLRMPPDVAAGGVLWVNGTTLQVNVGNENIGHTFYDRLWPVLVHLTMRALRDEPPFDHILLKGLSFPTMEGCGNTEKNGPGIGAI